ncbi:MAG: deoxyribose-phosphate aldolase [Eubacteriales bacterium]|nr:deoxyribose-phosphate aldolase [Eubacteriales bacterium]
MKFEKYFDHTILSATATKQQVKKVCDEAMEYNFASVCVNGRFTEYVKEQLAGSDVAVCVVVGFPLGAMSSQAKAAEAELAVKAGADEIDMVISVGALKEEDYDYVLNDIKMVRKACDGKVLKVIIETCLLTDEEKVKACQLAVDAGADFVKTSTGFSTGGAEIHDISLMKAAVGDLAKVKASGGIRDYTRASAMIDAGADRLGTSATVKIMQGITI